MPSPGLTNHGNLEAQIDKFKGTIYGENYIDS